MRTGTLDAVSNRATFQMIRQIVDTETGAYMSRVKTD